MDGPVVRRGDVRAGVPGLPQLPVGGEEEVEFPAAVQLRVLDLLRQRHGQIAHAGGVEDVEGEVLVGGNDVHVDVDQV